MVPAAYVTLRGETLRRGRIAQTARRRNKECGERKRAEYKNYKKELRRAIFSSKRLAWKEFTATLDSDP